jgi:FtsP/CotA-like multicopper oxidase with cupredoxin domain
MLRRQFLKYGAFGAAAALVPTAAFAQTGPILREFNLAIDPVDAELIDGTIVYMLVFAQDGGSGEPRPVLRVVQGDTVKITVRNRDDRQAHGFAVRGVTGASIASIPPNGEATVTFTAPAGGTYLYLDPTNAPLNRLLGLHGAFVSLPRSAKTPAGAPIPYSPVAQTAAAQAFFDALGVDPRYPGSRWSVTRDKIWLFHQIDPALHAAADLGQTIDPAGIAAAFRPRYFTMNGRSGFDLHGASDVTPRGYEGEPCLIRTLNAGLATHSPHIHGNHIKEVARSTSTGQVQVLSNIYSRDAWRLPPLAVVDVLLPFTRPPDAAVWPPKQEAFPLQYVMHCHTEMSQTAGGGNYPQGAVVHWELLGPRRVIA